MTSQVSSHKKPNPEEIINQLIISTPTHRPQIVEITDLKKNSFYGIRREVKIEWCVIAKVMSFLRPEEQVSFFVDRRMRAIIHHCPREKPLVTERIPPYFTAAIKHNQKVRKEELANGKPISLCTIEDHLKAAKEHKEEERKKAADRVVGLHALLTSVRRINWIDVVVKVMRVAGNISMLVLPGLLLASTVVPLLAVYVFHILVVSPSLAIIVGIVCKIFKNDFFFGMGAGAVIGLIASPFLASFTLAFSSDVRELFVGMHDHIGSIATWKAIVVSSGIFLAGILLHKGATLLESYKEQKKTEYIVGIHTIENAAALANQDLQKELSKQEYLLFLSI